METGAREQPPVQNEVARIISDTVVQCCKAHNCFFEVVGTVGNDSVSYKVAKQDKNVNNTYVVVSAFNFYNKFVLIKIEKYLNL